MENNEKIYGIYPGLLKVDELEKCDEYVIWATIQNLGDFIYYTNKDLAHDRIHEFDNVEDRKKVFEDIQNAQYAIEYLVYYTRKFGVTFDREPKAGENVQRSESYDKWYKFWKDHFNNLSDEDFRNFDKAQRNGEDVSKYLPKTSWNDEEKE